MTDINYKKLGFKSGIEIHTQPFSLEKKNAGEKERNFLWEIQ